MVWNKMKNMSSPTVYDGLDSIAGHLEALEEKILFGLLDRAQYRQNGIVYEPGKSGFEGHPDENLLDLRLLEEEQLDARWGRFTAPEEKSFNEGLPPTERCVERPDTGLVTVELNLTPSIRNSYLSLVPYICEPGDDGQYGSSVEFDVAALRAISERVHFGSLYVAERKFQDDEPKYSRLIKTRDGEGLRKALTRPEVESRIIERVHEKVGHYQRMSPMRHQVDPNVIASFYRGIIIELTKDGEVSYLLQRLR